MLLQFNKSEIELTLSQPLLELIELVSNSYTLKEYEDSKFNPLKFYGNGINDWGEFNKTTTPTEWLSIYKYSKEYGNWSSTSKSCNPSWKGNILDFGAGSGTPWINIHPGMTLYLLEANLFLANGLKETYSTYSNVKVINSLKEVSNIKFDYIYSKDVLEHVRYINEHLNILYYLGNIDCAYSLEIDEAPSPGHVLNLHKDSIIDSFWLQFKV
jgi:hypothetical protein